MAATCGTTCWRRLGVPRHPLLLARFGMRGASAGAGAGGIALWRAARAGPVCGDRGAFEHAARGLRSSAAIGLVLGVLRAYAVGWPFPRGGAQRISDALAGYLRSLGGEIRTGSPVTAAARRGRGDVRRDAAADAALGGRSISGAVSQGAGTVIGTVPACSRWTGRWMGRSPGVRRNVTAPARCISAARWRRSREWEASHTGRPFVLLAQHSFSIATRAPEGRHTAWAYCHVANGSTRDMTDAIEAQVERFAPGFRQRILGRHVFGPAAMESHNPNLVGGDFNGGALSLRQFFLRPTRRLYRTPLAGVYFCGSSTPPGGGVHGMCGFHAASRINKGVR